MSTLLLKNINKIYPNNVQAVFDFNLEIKDKEFIVFVGPSGCGKSTTLRMVAGLEEITLGELYIDGKLVNDVVPKNRDIAMVFQSYALYPHMTVYGNMEFALKLRKIPMPLYIEEENEEINALNSRNEELWDEIHKIDKKFKKDQNNLELLKPRQVYFKELVENLDKIKSLRKPVIGRDEYTMALIRKAIAKAEAEIAKYQNILDTKQPNEMKAKIISDGIAQRQGKIEKLNKDLKYLEENDVPLTKLRHLTKKEISVEVNKAAASIDLIKYLYRKPAALSGGQRQRVALGRAIVRKPKVFLMDEPLSNLDAKLRVQTRSEIIKIHRRVGATTIYVTHDQTEAMTMADRIVIMKDGYIQQIGTPVEVYSDPDNVFVGGFIGSPAMNFLNVKLSKGVLDILPFKSETTDLLTSDVSDKPTKLKLPKQYASLLKNYEGKELILGVRPEDIYFGGDKHNEAPSDEIKLNCDYAELLGYELVLYSYISGQRIIVKTSAKRTVETGEDFKIAFDENKLYFFDKDSQKRIR